MLVTLPGGWTTVTALWLYATPDYSDDSLVAPVTPSGSTWVFDDAAVPAGRYYLRVVGTQGEATVTRDDGYVDLPDDPSLVVSPEVLARKAKIPLPLEPEDRETVIDAIRDAQADVVAYLGREITPVTKVETGRWAWTGADWDLTGLGDEDLIRVVSAVPEIDPVTGLPGDYFTVTYVMGLDGRHDPALHPIRRFVTAHALNSPDFVDLWKRLTKAKGDVKTVSAEGQSISFTTPTLGGGGEAGSAKPGALPVMSSLDRWRLAGRRVHQAKSRTSDWPFTGAPW